MPFSASYRPAAHIGELGEGFYDAVVPARFPLHRLRFRNQRWAERVGLGDLDAAEWELITARVRELGVPILQELPVGLGATGRGPCQALPDPDGIEMGIRGA